MIRSNISVLDSQDRRYQQIFEDKSYYYYYDGLKNNFTDKDGDSHPAKVTIDDEFLIIEHLEEGIHNDTYINGEFKYSIQYVTHEYEPYMFISVVDSTITFDKDVKYPSKVFKDGKFKCYLSEVTEQKDKDILLDVIRRIDNENEIRTTYINDREKFFLNIKSDV